jgi:hypothetical protein
MEAEIKRIPIIDTATRSTRPRAAGDAGTGSNGPLAVLRWFPVPSVRV